MTKFLLTLMVFCCLQWTILGKEETPMHVLKSIFSDVQNLTARNSEGLNVHNQTSPGKSDVSLLNTETTINQTLSNLSKSQRLHLEWRDLYNGTLTTMNALVEKLLPKVLKLIGKASLRNKCISSLIKLIVGGKEMKRWALRILDASSKLPAGILDATMSDLGDFDECVSVVHKEVRRNKMRVIRGQYCGVAIGVALPDRPDHFNFNDHVLDFSNFTPNDSVFRDIAGFSEYFYDNKLLLGLCIPDGCSGHELQTVLRQVLGDIPLTLDVVGCHTKEPYSINREQIAILSVVGVFVILAVLGTIYDSFCGHRNDMSKEGRSTVGRFLTSFSVCKNFGLLWTSKTKEGHLRCLDGIRVLSMAWIMISHLLITHAINATGRYEEGRKLVYYVPFQILSNGFISVDSFFFIGGLLVFYVNFNRMERNKGHLDLSKYFFHRLWRIMPPLWIVLGLIFILPLIGSGPLWHTVVDPQLDKCRQNWWSVMSGISSWFKREDMCLQDMWYVSNDLHYFLLVPVVLISLYKWPCIGMGIVLLLGTAAAATVALLTKFYHYYPVIMYTQPDKRSVDSMMSEIQYRFYGHLGTYCIGIITGYVLTRHSHVRIPRFFQIIGWGLAIGTSSLVVFSPYDWTLGRMPTVSISAAYASLHRVAWGLSLAWVTFMCATGKGGCVNTLLSWRSWRPLCNLSYAAYLVHFPYLWLRNGYRRERISLSIYELVNELFAISVMTVFIAIGFHLLFVAPWPNLEDLIFPTKHKESPVLPGQMEALDKKPKKKDKCNGQDSVRVTKIEVIQT